MVTPQGPVQSEDDPLSAATARLERACSRLAARMNDLSEKARQGASDAQGVRDSDADRARLAEALDAAGAREAVLAEAAEDASVALRAAMAELKALLEAPSS